MGLEKMPLSSEIPWDKIREVKVSSDKRVYSVEFELDGRRQKMTIDVSPEHTSFTLSGTDGSPIVHVAQKDDQLSVYDFGSKSALPKWVKGMQKKSS